MPRASKNNLISEKELLRLEGNLSYLLSTLASASDVKIFMSDFLSDEENIMLSKRLALYVMLDLNIDTQTIMNALSVSLETVRTHRMRYDRQSKEFKEMVRKIHKREKLDKKLAEIGEIAKDVLEFPDRPKKSKSSKRFGSLPNDK